MISLCSLCQQKQEGLAAQAPVPVVALVGYTNAGKSTLLNRVTEAAVLAEDKLFATLDPTTRKVALPSSKEVCTSHCLKLQHE